jgi:hypothetical protein
MKLQEVVAAVAAAINVRNTPTAAQDDDWHEQDR